jgi:hypothetical protein
MGEDLANTPLRFSRWSSAKERARAPKESILGCFDVTAISRYFPEFERGMPRDLSQF